MNNTKNIGSRVKEFRENRSISISQLAERTSLSERVIELIEAGESLPSLSPLVKISRALGVRIGTFLDDSNELGPVVSRSSERNTGVHFLSSNNSANEHLNFIPLASTKAARHFEPFVVEIEASKSHQINTSSHEGEEFLYVLEGSVEVIYGKQSITLNVGDSIYYDSVVEHHVHSANGKPARLLVVLYAPF